LFSVALLPLRDGIFPIMSRFGLGQKAGLWSVAGSCMAGAYLHVLLDSFLYSDIRPFTPFPDNPLLGSASPVGVYALCAALLFIGGALLALALSGKRVGPWP
jgi:hypothetical protein